MATISTVHMATLVNVFKVEPEKQDELAQILINATEQTMKHLPGLSQRAFIKASTGRRSSTTLNGKAKKISRP